MATNYGNRIPTRELRFLFDASDKNSYQGNNSTWKNIGTDSSNMTFANSVTYATTNSDPNSAAYYQFDGGGPGDLDLGYTSSVTIAGNQTLSAFFNISGGPRSPAGIITHHNFQATANIGINHIGGNKLGASIGYTVHVILSFEYFSPFNPS